MYDTKSYTIKHLLRVILRKENAFDQLMPIYSGWKSQAPRKDTGTSVIKTMECYFPSITSKAAD